MSDLVLLPDAPELLYEFLVGQDEITTLVGTDVYRNFPAGFDGWPAIRLTHFSTSPITQRPLWLALEAIQVEAFGGPQKTASTIARTCMAVMAERLPGEHENGVVTGVDFFGWRNDHDQTYQPARPRSLFVANIYCRPTGAGLGS